MLSAFFLSSSIKIISGSGSRFKPLSIMDKVKDTNLSLNSELCSNPFLVMLDTTILSLCLSTLKSDGTTFLI